MTDNVTDISRNNVRNGTCSVVRTARSIACDAALLSNRTVKKLEQWLNMLSLLASVTAAALEGLSERLHHLGVYSLCIFAEIC